MRCGVHHLAGEMCAACIDVKEKQDRMSYIGQRGTPYLCKLVSETSGREVHNGEEVFHLIEEGNEKALQGLQAYTDDLALIIFNMFVLLDLEKVCIGGGISCQPVLMECLEKSIQNIVTFHPDIVQGTQYPLPEVDVCRYFNDANLLGALYTFLKTW
ncbi:MAG: ROK family protein [Bulleidia sp.]|nr:ROK family protein [Bulleidia sp.]